MARIRTIKPEFWGDEKMAPMRPIDRLVFLALISMADDAGRLVDSLKSIDGFVFPETEDSSRDSLDTLASTGRILRYISASGQRLIQVTNWQRHQRVDKPAKYVLPSPSGESREDVATISRSDLGPTTNDQGPTTSDPRPPTAAASRGSTERAALGVNGQPLREARDELAVLLGGKRSEGTVDDFLAAAPSETRFAWARGLVAMLDPPGGQPVPADALLVAMQDFLVADRARWPFAGRVFRAFVDDVKRPKAERKAEHTHPEDALARWARETAERESRDAEDTEAAAHA